MFDVILNCILDIFRYSTPLLLVALGVLIIEVAGVVNMGAEGMMIIGCLTAVGVSYYTGSVWIGSLAAALVVALCGLLFFILVIEFRINQVVLGIAFNLVGTGLTTTLNRAFFNGMIVQDTFGKDALGFSLPTYLAIGCVILMWVFLYKTNPGILVRATGENTRVVESVGSNVKLVRYLTGMVGGLLIGLGGAYLSVGILSQFNEGMTEGRGFIALAAVTFGKFNPITMLFGVLVFGLGEFLSYHFQVGGSSIPYQFVLMLPYLMTVVSLCAFSKNAKDPAALGVPYVKSK